MANEVRLTFVGDAGTAPAAMAEVGGAADQMADKVDDASRSMRDSGESFDRAAEGFDKAEQRAMGFRDTITGVQDSVKGFGSILKGDFSGDALLAAGMGIGDLASGFSNFLVPAMKNAVSWLGKTKVGMAIATAAQWLWNAAIAANPIVLITLAIIALIAIIVLLVTHWDQVKEAGGRAWGWIKDRAVDFWEWLKALPGNIGNLFSTIGGFISAPFRAAFNFVADAWNNTVGRLRWTVPRWVPIIGGNSIGAPQLPKFHTGTSRVPGRPGQEMIAILQAGERVSPAGQAGGGTPMLVNLMIDGRVLATLLIDPLSGVIKDRGGNVQVVLGR